MQTDNDDDAAAVAADACTFVRMMLFMKSMKWWNETNRMSQTASRTLIYIAFNLIYYYGLTTGRTENKESIISSNTK